LVECQKQQLQHNPQYQSGKYKTFINEYSRYADHILVKVKEENITEDQARSLLSIQYKKLKAQEIQLPNCKPPKFTPAYK